MFGYRFLKIVFHLKNMKNIKNILDFVCYQIRKYYKNILLNMNNNF